MMGMIMANTDKTKSDKPAFRNPDQDLRHEWERPALSRLDSDSAEAAINIGADIGIYS
jgi:hypothetical protein